MKRNIVFNDTTTTSALIAEIGWSEIT